MANDGDEEYENVERVGEKLNVGLDDDLGRDNVFVIVLAAAVVVVFWIGIVVVAANGRREAGVDVVKYMSGTAPNDVFTNETVVYPNIDLS